MKPSIIDTELEKSLSAIQAIKAQIDLIGNTCKQIKIKDDVTLAIAQQNLSKANEMAKFIENKRVAIKAPYLAAYNTVDSTAKTISAILKEGISHVKSEVLAWEKKKEEEKKAKQALIDTQLEEAKKALESVPLTPAVINEFQELQLSAESEKNKLAASDLKTRGIRHQWKFELTDISKVPVEWLTIDEAKIKEWMKINKESLKEGELNGVKFYKEKIVTA